MHCTFIVPCIMDTKLFFALRHFEKYHQPVIEQQP